MPTGQQSEYAATVLDIALDTIKNSTYGSRFNNYIYGNPEEEIGADECPLVIGIKENTKILQGPTGMDQITYSLLLRIVISKYNFGETPASDSDVITFRELENMIEGIDSVTGLYDSNSIIGLLRTNYTLGNYAARHDEDINYGKVINPIIDEITREAQIKITIDKLQLTPNKQ